MDAERVRIEVADHVAEVRMVRGDKHNGLDWRMFLALNEAVDALREQHGVRVVVLCGDGPSFCAGLDFASFLGGDGDLTGDALERPNGELANRAQRVAFGWRQLPVPVIAAVHGACFGGGLQIALGADLRIAAPDTRVSVMEIRYGLVPDMSLWQTLPRLVRNDVARELAYTGRIVEAEEALALGLVTRVEADPVAVAQALAGEIAARSPDAIRRIKRLANLAPMAPAEGLRLEEELQRELLGTPNQAAAVQATLAKQPAEFADPTEP
jgi:enoyl-CoA hydratase/carnithine racemase